jgi:hypothetical protein
MPWWERLGIGTRDVGRSHRMHVMRWQRPCDDGSIFLEEFSIPRARAFWVSQAHRKRQQDQQPMSPIG